MVVQKLSNYFENYTYLNENNCILIFTLFHANNLFEICCIESILNLLSTR